jgi:hypothetical protein
MYGVADLGYGKAYAALYRVGFPTHNIIQPVTVTKSQMNHIAWRSVKDSREVSVGGFHTLKVIGVGYRNRGVKDSAGFFLLT